MIELKMQELENAIEAVDRGLVSLSSGWRLVVLLFQDAVDTILRFTGNPSVVDQQMSNLFLRLCYKKLMGSLIGQ